MLQKQSPGSNLAGKATMALACWCIPLLLLSCGEVYSDLEVPRLTVGTALFNPITVNPSSDQYVDVTVFGLPEGANNYWKNNAHEFNGLELLWQADTSCASMALYQQELLEAEETTADEPTQPSAEYDENGNPKHCFLLKVYQSAEEGEFGIMLTFYTGSEEVFAMGSLFVVEPQ